MNSRQWNWSEFFWNHGRGREVQKLSFWEEKILGGREGTVSKGCFCCFRHAQWQGLKNIEKCKLYCFFFFFLFVCTVIRGYFTRCIDSDICIKNIHRYWKICFVSLHTKSSDITGLAALRLYEYLCTFQKINKWSFSLKAFSSSTCEPSAMRIMLPLVPNFFSASNLTSVYCP